MRWHQLRRIWLLTLLALLILIPWAAGIWYLTRHAWAWYGWAGTALLIVLSLVLLRPRLPLRTSQDRPPSVSAAEERARVALQQRIAAIGAEDLGDLESLPKLVIGAFQDVAESFAPRHPAALWRFTLSELLRMVEDLTQCARRTLLIDFPMLRHIELSWIVTLLGVSDPLGRLMRFYPVLRWVNPRSALVSTLCEQLRDQPQKGARDPAKVQLGAALVAQAGETAIRLYSGGYRRRTDEALPMSPASDRE